MSCTNGCFEAFTQQCDDIIIRAGLPPNFPIYWIVKKVGKTNSYQKLTSTENNGDLVISQDDLPDGYLVAGDNIRIELRLGSNYLYPVLMTFDGEQYSCIMAKLQNVITDDDVPANVIFGHTSVVPDGPGSPYLIEIDEDDFRTEDNDPSPDTYLNGALDGKVLAIFHNDLNRYLTANEWEHVDGGIKILIEGFDATANAYILKIFIIGNEPVNV